VHLQVSAVSASIPLDEFGFVKNSETVPKSPGYFLLVPRLRLGTDIFRALPGNYVAFRPIMEAEPGKEK